MDVCVVTYRNDASRVAAALRPGDRLFVWDNSYHNLGFAAGANAAARRGCGAIIVFVNPDGDPGPECFDALEAALAEPGVVAAEASQGPRWDRPAIDEHGTMEWLSGACMAVYRTAFEQAGGFDERLFMYCEDVDLSYRLAALGRLFHCRSASFRHDDKPRSFIALHRSYRNWLVIQRRWRKATPARMLRDAGFAVRQGYAREALARLTGVTDYTFRAWRWA